MRGINRVILVATLGADPEARTTSGGTVVSNFRVAVNESWKDKNSGQKQERTEWISITAFGRLAEIVNKYLVKGSKAYIEGKLRTEKSKDKQGNDRYSTKVYMDELQMLDSPQQGGQQQRQEPPARRKEQSSGPPPDAFDDDINF